jgi:hypothetical protein
MKKLIGLVALAFLSATLFADSSMEPVDTSVDTSMDQSCEVEVSEPCEVDICAQFGSFILNEIKLGYFRFGDKKLRHSYQKGLLDVQLTSSFCFWKPLYAYVGVEYIGSNGRIPGSHTKINIRMVPISLGIQYMQPITCDLKYYLTAGARYFFVHQWTRSKSLTPNGCGGFANTGFIYYLSNHIVIDFFGEYSFKKLHFDNMGGGLPNSLQVGGMTLGAGIGYFW